MRRNYLQDVGHFARHAYLYDGCTDTDARESFGHHRECRQIADRVRQGDCVLRPFQPGGSIQKGLANDDTASQSWNFRQGFLEL